jgi:hypothetical protein
MSVKVKLCKIVFRLKGRGKNTAGTWQRLVKASAEEEKGEEMYRNGEDK